MEGWIYAAVQNDVEMLEKLRSECVGSEAADGKTALITATERNSLDAIKLLRNFELDICDSEGRNALFYAHSIQAAALLKDAISKTDNDENTALHYYVLTNNIDLVEFFANHCRAQNALGRTPLHLAAEAGNAECCMLLLGALGIEDNEHKRALLGGVCSGNTEVVRLLEDEVDGEALRFACLKDREMAAILVEAAKRLDIARGLDDFTRKCIYDSLGDPEFAMREQEPEDAEFETIRAKLVHPNDGPEAENEIK